MNKVYSVTIIVSIILTKVRCNFAYFNNIGHLQPVQGLYMKPAGGGSNDLFVAATEDNGVQWLTDKPVNYMSVAPSAFNYYTVPRDETFSSLQKRSVAAPSPIAYTYAVPTSGNEAAAYAVPSTTETKCSESTPTAMPYPYHFFYPHLLSAIASGMSAAKEGSGTEDGSAVPTPVWPQSYPYPIQYLMVDPSTWTQFQTTPAATTPPPATTSAPNDKTA